MERKSRLKEILDRYDVKYSRFADRAGVNRNTMSYIVNGKWPTLKIAHKIIHALNEQYGLSFKIEDIWPYEDMDHSERE